MIIVWRLCKVGKDDWQGKAFCDFIMQVHSPLTTSRISISVRTVFGWHSLLIYNANGVACSIKVLWLSYDWVWICCVSNCWLLFSYKMAHHRYTIFRPYKSSVVYCHLLFYRLHSHSRRPLTSSNSNQICTFCHQDEGLLPYFTNRSSDDNDEISSRCRNIPCQA